MSRYPTTWAHEQGFADRRVVLTLVYLREESSMQTSLVDKDRKPWLFVSLVYEIPFAFYYPPLLWHQAAKESAGMKVVERPVRFDELSNRLLSAVCIPLPPFPVGKAVNFRPERDCLWRWYGEAVGTAMSKSPQTSPTSISQRD